MTVKIYKLSGAGSEVSSDTSFNNPILWEASQLGGTLEARFFLRNDEPGTFATNVQVSAVDSAGSDESIWYEFALFSFALDNGGSPDVYLPSLENLTIPEGSEVPFWIKIDVPQAVEVGPKTDVRIKVTAIILDSEA